MNNDTEVCHRSSTVFEDPHPDERIRGDELLPDYKCHETSRRDEKRYQGMPGRPRIACPTPGEWDQEACARPNEKEGPYPIDTTQLLSKRATLEVQLQKQGEHWRPNGNER